MSILSQGDRVFHPNQKEWGVGKVLSVTPDNIDVFFVGAGAKRLSTSFVRLDLAAGEVAKHALLDNLSEASQAEGTAYIPLPMAVDRFLKIYPDGLEGKRFLKEGREATLNGHQFCVRLLGEEELAGLIEEGRYQDICDRARHVESVTNLLTKSEKTLFYGALEQPENQKLFAEGLANLLYGADPEELRFKRFVRMLDLLAINKWPIATLFGFIRFPKDRVFIKPTMIQNAAKAFFWRINYKPEPNVRTYDAVLRFYHHVRTSLLEEGMMARDLVDVHAIIAAAVQK